VPRLELQQLSEEETADLLEVVLEGQLAASLVRFPHLTSTWIYGSRGRWITEPRLAPHEQDHGQQLADVDDNDERSGAHRRLPISAIWVPQEGSNPSHPAPMTSGILVAWASASSQCRELEARDCRPRARAAHRGVDGTGSPPDR
jgi:hypothetical protein